MLTKLTAWKGTQTILYELNKIATLAKINISGMYLIDVPVGLQGWEP